MSRAWHIAKKDLLRLRWIVILWGVILTGGLVFTTIQSGLDADTYLPFFVVANVLIAGLVPLTAFGLVMGLMHDDSVAEIDAFWITRPISGGELLAAKALAWILLGLVPLVIMAPFWLGQDFSWYQAEAAAGLTFRGHCLIAVLALPFAVLSANGSKFVMNVIVGSGAILLVTLLLHLGRTSGSPSSPGLRETKAWLIAGLWIATTIFVTLNQFLRRKRRQSAFVIALAALTAVVVAKWWPGRLELPHDGQRPLASGGRFQGLGVIPVSTPGGATRLAIVAEVPLRQGATAAHAGTRLWIQSVLLDLTGAVQISFSQSESHAYGSLSDLLPDAPAPVEHSTRFFIINLNDGRAFPVYPTHFGTDLRAAGIVFSHWKTSARPGNSWVGGAPEDLPEWLRNAVLAETTLGDVGSRSETTGHFPPPL
jgi:hypothetical protein